MSKKNKQSNKIDLEDEVLNLRSRGFSVHMLNYFTLRVTAPEISENIYDWYFTTGTVVKNKWTRLPRKFKTSDQLGDLIVQESQLTLF